MLVFMLLSEYIVDIEKLDSIFLLTFVVDEFSGLILDASIFSIIYLRNRINDEWWFIKFLSNLFFTV